MRRNPWSISRVLAGATAATVLFLSAAWSTQAVAQNYPSNSIKVVVPYGPGGPVDTSARIIGNFLSDELGQPVVIENRPGAGSAVGGRYVANAAPDGYTLLMGNTSTFAFAPFALKEAGYQPSDFEAVALVGESTVVLAAHPSLPAKTVEEMVEYAKANPGAVFLGTIGVGNTAQLSAEMLKRRADIDIDLVPFGGAGELAVALLGGHVHLAFIDLSTTLQHIEAGRLNALAIAGVQRAQELLPDVPAIGESGFPELANRIWTGLAAPVGTDGAIVARLNEAVNKALEAEEVNEALTRVGIRGQPNTPEHFRQLIDDESVRWSGIIKEVGIAID